MKILNSWGDVWNYKDRLFICVTDESVNEYLIDTRRYLQNFSKFDVHNKTDYISNQDNVILYLQYVHEDRFQNSQNKPNYWHTFIFKKNKLYDFSNTGRWQDEIGNVIDGIKFEIWYEPFLFVKEKDIDQAIRLLKLKNLNK